MLRYAYMFQRVQLFNSANVMAMQARQMAENISANKFWALSFCIAYS
jgi:hypothetical protein